MPQAFSAISLHPSLQAAIARLGFTHMTPIQEQVLQFTLGGHDAIGRAQTGTGKTAAFLISIINDLLYNPLTEQRYRGEPRALIMAPTRELALQITKDAEGLTHGTPLRMVTLLGGMDYDQQKRALSSGPVDILVATPGRLIDFVNQQQVWLDRIEFLVIDEADRLLDMGFIPDVMRIIRNCPPKANRQTLMFSATFSYDVLNLAQQWLHHPVTVEIEPSQTTSQQVEQHVYIIAKADKERLLDEILERETIDKVMIFANRRDQVKRVYDKLRSKGHAVGMLSGDIPQDRRIKMLDAFKQGRTQILVATDVAGRGIHVEGVSHVINYTMPDQVDDYVHRIGRTGRAGAKGVSISFACEDDSFMLADLERRLGKKLALERPEGY